jgi:hypothetical protein
MSKIGVLFYPARINLTEFCSRKVVSKRINRFKFEEVIEEEII